MHTFQDLTRPDVAPAGSGPGSGSAVGDGGGTSPRNRRAGVAVAAIMAIAVLCAACGINWSYNKNFGTVIEPGAARASMAIYRAPRKFLYQVYEQNGIRPVQDIIYASGSGPLVQLGTVCVGSYCLGTGFLASVFHGLVYDRGPDLAEALTGAQSSLDCLDLTIISYGGYAPNWTHKSVGCQIGSL